MTVVIKSNELNLLIYKYFLESGLQHSAYTLFNEADVLQAANQYKFDVKAGHLVSLLQKALIFTQIQSHMNFSEYMQCNQPFHLLKKHTCTITEKIKQNKQKMLQELNNNILDSIRRTNSIQYQEIIYEPRGINYIDKWPKIKLNRENIEKSQNKLIIKGDESGRIAIYDYDDKCLTLIKNDFQIEALYPSVAKSALTILQNFQISGETLIEMYPQNSIIIKYLEINPQDPQITTFTLTQFSQQIHNCSFNSDFPFLVVFSNRQNNKFCLVNLKNMKIILQANGKFLWRAYNQYIIYDQNGLNLNSLGQPNTNHQFQISQVFTFIYSELLRNTNYSNQQQQNIIQCINKCQQTLCKDNITQIYTFDNSEPLYKFQEQQNNIIQAQWVCSKQVDYLVYLTTKHLKLWEVQLNGYSKIIQLSQYDKGLSSIAVIDKNDSEKYIIGIGQCNFIIYDVSMIKIQRIQLNTQSYQMNALNKSKLALWNENYVYTVSEQQLEPLFL